jgi:predicted small metal-binding protein
MKTLRCRDVGFDCEGVIQATSEEEILSQAAEHAQAAHNVQVTPELAEQLKTLIRDEE